MADTNTLMLSCCSLIDHDSTIITECTKFCRCLYVVLNKLFTNNKTFDEDSRVYLVIQNSSSSWIDPWIFISGILEFHDNFKMPTWNQIQSQLKNPNNSVVFLDVTVGNTEIGRMIIELFSDLVPKTCENFRQFCTGEYKRDGIPMGYKGSSFHRVIKDFMIQGGDFINGDGTGVMSIYGGVQFEDENFNIKHDGPGLLAMANSGQNSNGCQFYITCTNCKYLDGKHVVFGRVIDGLLVMRKIENVPIGPNNKPKIPVIISQCGQM